MRELFSMSVPNQYALDLSAQILSRFSLDIAKLALEISLEPEPSGLTGRLVVYGNATYQAIRPLVCYVQGYLCHWSTRCVEESQTRFPGFRATCDK